MKPAYEGQLVPKPDGWYVRVTTTYQNSQWTSPLVKLEATEENTARTKAAALINRFARACAGPPIRR